MNTTFNMNFLFYKMLPVVNRIDAQSKMQKPPAIS
jgi:hypothetical protein